MNPSTPLKTPKTNNRLKNPKHNKKKHPPPKTHQKTQQKRLPSNYLAFMTFFKHLMLLFV